MTELLLPTEISIRHIISKKSLSPSNFATIDIINHSRNKISYFLNKDYPFEQGVEPGSFAYVKKSQISFIRNSCIDSFNFSNIEPKEIFLNPKYEFENSITSNDVLMCKDANIGDACLFITEKNHNYLFSSGVVKLNFSSNLLKYYVFAFLRDRYFLSQLDLLTPKGSTLRHAGDRFLDCIIPAITRKEENLLSVFEALIKNIAYAERYSFKNLERSNKIIEEEIFINDLESKDSHISDLKTSMRIDAGYFSDLVKTIEYNIRNYKFGSLTLESFGFSLKRGPNLQKRDLGRSIKSEFYKPNYHLLVYPSDISDYGYILREEYIGARNPVWYLKRGDILFSAEGTVGKVFVICDEDMKFITNIHGILISPLDVSPDLYKSIFLGQYLHYLRSKGYFGKISVGGQGGSFAVNYWKDFFIPNISQEVMKKSAPLYYNYNQQPLIPFQFDETALLSAGVFELNNFRILCTEILKRIVNDIKSDMTQDLNYYKEYFQKN